MSLTRSSGILLHPTSFPGPDGIGDLGPQAYYWVDFLKAAGCTQWQILPLGPTGFGDSPYQCFSAFAGNHYLISPTILLDDGLLTTKDFADRPDFPTEYVDFGMAIPWKLTLLDRAFEHFKEQFERFKDEFESFCRENESWLTDYALFMALKDAHNGSSWQNWDAPYKKREPAAIEAFKKENANEILRHLFRQFLFARQWGRLKAYANKNGISIIGDIPIFVSMDSSDVWSAPELFFLDGEGNPTVVAGVPPDYFCETGQLWGNPLYNWQKHQETGFAWWIRRIQNTLKVCDLIRLDHFRGFCGYWEVPAGNPTAQYGRWVEAPGFEFLKAVKEALGGLPLIAEDLGEISKDVADLRDSYDLPGMKILQFAFSDGPNNAFLTTNYVPNCIAYSGTHDNNTAVGAYKEEFDDKARDFARKYFASNGEHIAWDMIRGIWQSVAVYAIAPLQDFLELDSNSRMNTPGRAQGNWSWRFKASDLTPDLAFRILELNRIYNRCHETSTIPPYFANIPYEKA